MDKKVCTMKAELRAKLERTLRRPIPQTTWDKFDRDGRIDDYFAGRLEHEGGERENFQALKGMFADELDYLKALHREMAQTTTEPPTEEKDSTPPIELELTHNSYIRT